MYLASAWKKNWEKTQCSFPQKTIEQGMEKNKNIWKNDLVMLRAGVFVAQLDLKTHFKFRVTKTTSQKL